MCPYLEARNAEHDVSKNREDKPKDLEMEWLARLEKTDLNEHTLAGIAHDIYQSQERRILSIENKAMSMIIAISFFILVLSIFVAFYDDDGRSTTRLAVLLILIPAITNLFLAGMAAIKAFRITPRHFVILDDLKSILPLQNEKILVLAARYLSNVERNVQSEIIKSSWSDAAQTHIRNGVIYVMIATGLTIVDLC